MVITLFGNHAFQLSTDIYETSHGQTQSLRMWTSTSLPTWTRPRNVHGLECRPLSQVFTILNFVLSRLCANTCSPSDGNGRSRSVPELGSEKLSEDQTLTTSRADRATSSRSSNSINGGAALPASSAMLRTLFHYSI